jgi:hypothetical protein
MALHPRGTLLILVVACALQTLAAGQSGYIQAPPAASQRQQNAQPASQAPDPSITQTEERAIYRHLLLVRFSYFLEYGGRENFLIQKETRGRNPQPLIEKTDYESAIGIGDGEEQVMLEIVHDAGPQIIENWDQIDAATMKFLEQHGSGESIQDDPELKALYRNQLELIQEARASLKKELGAKFLGKFDAYVFREFFDRDGPVSLWRQNPNSSEGNASALGQAQPDEFALGDKGSFALFFQASGAVDERIRRAAAEGKDWQVNTLPANTPNDKKQAVHAIVLGAYHQIRDNIEQDYAVIGEYHRADGPQPIPHPLPPGLAMLSTKFWEIVNENRAEVRKVLGEEDFTKFDESVNQVFGEREIGAASDLASQPKPPQPRRDSAPAQTP